LNNEDTELFDENQPAEVVTAAPEKKYKKVLGFIFPVLILLLSFIAGFIYFFNFDVVVKYLVVKEGIPLEIDKLNLHLSGKFDMERLKYGFRNRQGVTDQVKAEYVGGSVSPFSLLLSKKLVAEMNFKGIKVPFESGMISGGSWKIICLLKNVSKNIQQWEGEVTLMVENAMLQYSVMNVNYTAVIKTGKIKGQIKNSLLQLENSELLTDIARVTIGGNATINYPYNINVQLNLLPTDEFGNKYPDIKGMLSALLQKDPSLEINLTGTIDRLTPQIKNLLPQ